MSNEELWMWGEVLTCVRSAGCCWAAGGCRFTYSVHACACDHVYTDREMYKLCFMLAPKGSGVFGQKWREIRFVFQMFTVHSRRLSPLDSNENKLKAIFFVLLHFLGS